MTPLTIYPAEFIMDKREILYIYVKQEKRFLCLFNIIISKASHEFKKAASWDYYTNDIIVVTIQIISQEKVLKKIKKEEKCRTSSEEISKRKIPKQIILWQNQIIKHQK